MEEKTVENIQMLNRFFKGKTYKRIDVPWVYWLLITNFELKRTVSGLKIKMTYQIYRQLGKDIGSSNSYTCFYEDATCNDVLNLLREWKECKKSAYVKVRRLREMLIAIEK